jgi:hypothetical protein
MRTNEGELDALLAEMGTNVSLPEDQAALKALMAELKEEAERDAAKVMKVVRDWCCRARIGFGCEMRLESKRCANPDDSECALCRRSRLIRFMQYYG